MGERCMDGKALCDYGICEEFIMQVCSLRICNLRTLPYTLRYDI